MHAQKSNNNRYYYCNVKFNKAYLQISPDSTFLHWGEGCMCNTHTVGCVSCTGNNCLFQAYKIEDSTVILSKMPDANIYNHHHSDDTSGAFHILDFYKDYFYQTYRVTPLKVVHPKGLTFRRISSARFYKAKPGLKNR